MFARRTFDLAPGRWKVTDSREGDEYMLGVATGGVTKWMTRTAVEERTDACNCVLADLAFAAYDAAHP
jgi:hypothetical protein